MHILLIEDNLEIQKNIKEYLEMEDYKVTTCSDGECGLDNAIALNYDIILLDLMLPKIDGITIAKKIKQKKQTPILMITAKDSIDEKLIWFSSGADDYIVKPFDLRELEARIQSVYNRGKQLSGNIYTDGDLEISLKNRVFKKAWEEVNITGKEFMIIEILLQNRWTTISRSEIIEDVWGEDALFHSDGKLDVYISNIRSKLWKDLIKTMKWYGYRI